MSFFVEFLKNPRQNASAVPSSARASARMLEGLDLSKMKYVVELGPGTGCFTAQLMEKLPESSEVLVLEINPLYCQGLREKYGSRFHVRRSSAQLMDDMVDELGWPRVDLIISGLPFTLPDDVLDPLYQSIQRRTKTGTTYRFFTYIPPLMKRRNRQFKLTLEHTVLRNFPPMWIYSGV